MSGGRYTFEREIGRGASGPVWSGHDTVLGRRVALKRVGVHPGGLAPAAEDGAREARLAASLNHAHVVGVLDLTVVGDEHWLVMELVDGTNLAQLVREQGPMEPARAALLLAQVAEALDTAHRSGIVHRDVKPSNVLVGTDGCAKLTDFGIARSSADDDQLTATGLVTGSPAYLAPEVATGASATPASDVWSLGATLFHLLAGRPPYHVGDNVMSTMYRIVHEDPPRLPEFGTLNLVLERTMATDPEDRWTMWQVHEALTHVAAQASGAVRPVAGGGQAYAGTGAPTSTRTTRAVASRRTYARPISGVLTRGAWVATAAAVVLASVLAFQFGRGGAGDGTVPAAAPRAEANTPPVTSASSEESTEKQMVLFVQDYLADVTEDPRTTWERLSPEFQEASGGLGSYQGFWRTVRTATPRNVSADAATMTVTYDVDYVLRNGRTTSDRVTLELAGSGSGLKVTGES